VNITRRTVLAAVSAAAVAQAQRGPRQGWKPKLGALGQYTEANVDFCKAEGFTSMEFRIDPMKTDDAAAASIKDKMTKSGLYISSLANDGNHIDPDPAKREAQITKTQKAIELCGKLGIPAIAGQSGQNKAQQLQPQVDEIVKVYTEKYFPLCEQHKVKILWEPYAGGPNIATGPVGWEALFKAFKDSPNVGLQFDPSHLVWQFMDEVKAARDFYSKIHDVHLKDTEILWDVVRQGGIQPVNNARWWRFRLPGSGSVNWKGFFAVLAENGFQGAMNIENEDPFYGRNYDQSGNFTEDFKRGFHQAHQFLKTLVPDVTA
jgi:sugar phosphate isomerase/epimerase